MTRFAERGAILATILLALSILVAVIWRTHCADQAAGVGFLNLCVAITLLLLKSLLFFIVRVLFDRLCYAVYSMVCFVARFDRKPYREMYKPSARLSSNLKRGAARAKQFVASRFGKS